MQRNQCRISRSDKRGSLDRKWGRENYAKLMGATSDFGLLCAPKRTSATPVNLWVHRERGSYHQKGASAGLRRSSEELFKKPRWLWVLFLDLAHDRPLRARRRQDA
jgi:hypothetical protein